MKNQSSYFRFILNSMDDNVGKTNQASFVGFSLIVIVVWVLLSSTGLQEAFKSIANLQQMMDVWQGGTVVVNYFETEDSASWWDSFSGVFSSSEDTQQKMSPFMRSCIANVCAILGAILFLAIVSKYVSNKQKIAWKDAVIVVGASCVPLTIGMFIAYVFFKMASKSESENIPSILYLLGSSTILTALMTSFIILHTNIFSILAIKERKRYYTTIFTVFLFAGILGAVTNSLT